MEDSSFADRMALLSAAKRAVVALRYNRGLSRAFLARSRVRQAVPAEQKFSIGDQVFYWRGLTKRKHDLGHPLTWTGSRRRLRSEQRVGEPSQHDLEVLRASCSIGRSGGASSLASSI